MKFYYTFKVVLITEILIKLAQASETCATDGGNKTGFACIDYGTSIAFCCESIYPGHHRCCYYTAWWGLWYVWLSIGIGVGIIAGLVTLLLRKMYVEESSTKVERLDEDAEEDASTRVESFSIPRVSGYNESYKPPSSITGATPSAPSNFAFSSYLYNSGKINAAFDDDDYPY